MSCVVPALPPPEPLAAHGGVSLSVSLNGQQYTEGVPFSIHTSPEGL